MHIPDQGDATGGNFFNQEENSEAFTRVIRELVRQTIENNDRE
jgi:hypothetical protein